MSTISELGEADFRIPSHVTKASIQAFKEGFTKYTPNAGLEELHAISEKLKRENDFGADPKGEIMVAAGAMNLLSLSICRPSSKVMKQGDEVVISDPGYVSYIAQVLLASGIPKHVLLLQKNEFGLTADDLERVANKKTRMIILNSPSNPTAGLKHKEGSKEIADIAADNDLLILTNPTIVYPGNQAPKLEASSNEEGGSICCRALSPYTCQIHSRQIQGISKLVIQ